MQLYNVKYIKCRKTRKYCLEHKCEFNLSLVWLFLAIVTCNFNCLRVYPAHPFWAPAKFPYCSRTKEVEHSDYTGYTELRSGSGTMSHNSSGGNNHHVPANMSSLVIQMCCTEICGDTLAVFQWYTIYAIWFGRICIWDIFY
jgi:hypothetical protein